MQEIINQREILTVSQLNRSVKKTLESHYQTVWIEGEVSNIMRPQSGHLYFTLKDAQAQVRCALFRLRNIAIPFELDNGMHILAFAKISLYEGRGDYQLIIEHIEEQGEGLLRKRFELLKQKLAQEGLFELASKIKVPTFPHKIGVITSPTGAAIRDVLSVLKRRFASIPVIIYPTLVQGDQAAKNIAHAISQANNRAECDVLIICRGGGSLEDLWPFNEEIVARAIFASRIPTISGVGHEIDFTITDFVVDQRAPTPSAAAELISPDRQEYTQRLLYFSQRLTHLIATDLHHRKINLLTIKKQLSRPDSLLVQYIQSVDILERSILRAIYRKFEQNKSKLELVGIKLKHLNPVRSLVENKKTIDEYLKVIAQLINQKIQDAKFRLLTSSRMLQAISPLNTLDRGYSITTKNSHIIDDALSIQLGDRIKIELRTGYLHCDVVEIDLKEE